MLNFYIKMYGATIKIAFESFIIKKICYLKKIIVTLKVIFFCKWHYLLLDTRVRGN